MVTAAGTQSVVSDDLSAFVADCSHFEEHFAIGRFPIMSLFVPNDLEKMLVFHFEVLVN